MKKKLFHIPAVSLVLLARVFAADMNLSDKILTAYPLSPMDESGFSLTDGESAFFWEQWDDLDRIEMNVNNNVYERCAPFDSSDDAAMVIKAAYSLKGLYLHMEVTDDAWITPSDFSDISCDVVELYFDSRTQEEIKNTPREDMATPWTNAISQTTKQVQVWMDANNVNYQYYDEALVNWVGIPALGGRNVLTLEEIQENYAGTGMEILEKSQNVRIQEWFLPWNELGIDIEAFPGNGIKFAFSGGYNDKDERSDEDRSCLRWLNYDPWSQGPRENPDEPQSPIIKVGECDCPQWALESWGHIYLPFPPPGGSTDVHNFASKMNITFQHSKIVKTEYFTLQGKRIPHQTIQKLQPNTIVIERSLVSDGSSKVQKMHVNTIMNK